MIVATAATVIAAICAAGLLRESLVLVAEMDRPDRHLGLAVGQVFGGHEALGRTRDPTILLFLEGSCAPCAQLVPHLDALGDQCALTVVVTGDDGRIPTGRSYRRIGEPESSRLAIDFNVHATPFSLAVKDGAVVGKVRVRNAADVVALAATCAVRTS